MRAGSVALHAEAVRDAVGFRGGLAFDTTKPDGTPRKLLDVSRLRNLGWVPRIGLADGLAAVYEWYVRSSAS